MPRETPPQPPAAAPRGEVRVEWVPCSPVMWDTVPETYSFLPKPEYSSNQLKMRHWERLRGLWILWHKFHGEDAPKVTWDIWPQVPPTGPWVPPKLWCLTYPNIPPQPITDPLRTLWWVVNASFCGWLVSICRKSAWLQVGKKAESGHHPCPPPPQGKHEVFHTWPGFRELSRAHHLSRASQVTHR